MKKNIWKVTFVLAALFAVQCVIAGPHHHRKDDGRGVRLATDIVNLVKAVVLPPPAPVVVTPAPAVVTPAPVVVAPAPAPVVVTPAPVTVAPPAVINYGYYNNVYVPCYNGWYYYGNVWCWGGPGRRPPHPPAWRPPHRHHRPAPPPPPRYRRPVAPPPPAYRHGGRPTPPARAPHHGGGRRPDPRRR